MSCGTSHVLERLIRYISRSFRVKRKLATESLAAFHNWRPVRDSTGVGAVEEVVLIKIQTGLRGRILDPHLKRNSMLDI
jgi:hypothetical protein